jgi:hypothetical protein
MSEIVYILSNAAMRGLLRIDMTDKENLVTHMEELYDLNVPVQYDCIYACTVKDGEAVRKNLHSEFAESQLHSNHSYFRMPPEPAVKALKAYEVEDITFYVREQIDASLLQEEKDARRQAREYLVKTDPTVSSAKDLHLMPAL